MNALLRLEHVTLARGGRVLAEALDLALMPGDGLIVGGPNGSGKSSLLRLAAGLLDARSGTVDRVSAAFADDRLALDAERPLAEALRLWLADPGPALAAMALEPLAAVPVRLLSSGQRKRAALARVIGSNAPLWLLDEPTNALDRETLERLDRAIDDHRTGGGAVLAASHVPLAGEWRRLELGR